MRRNREYPSYPLVGVGSFIHMDGRVLLIKRRFEPNKGRWSLPGGLLETGERLEEGVKREVREELGLEVETEKIFQVAEEIVPDENGKTKYHYVLVDFLAKPLSSWIILNEESEEYRWFKPQEVLHLNASENTKMIAKKYVAYLRQKSRH